MNIVECPKCGERIEAQSQSAAQAVNCPACQTGFIPPKQKARWIPGALSIVAGAVVFCVLFRFEDSFDSMLLGVMDICGIVLIGWGGASMLWTIEKSLRGMGAPLLILAGFLIMLAAAVSGEIIFVIVGGFMAVVGGMFFLKK